MMEQRTKAAALATIKLVGQFPNKQEYLVIGKQLLRSATSTGANYRAATRGRSDREFFAKLSIVIEECDETLYWIELLKEGKMISEENIKDIEKEYQELLKILAKSRKTLSENKK